MNPITFVKPQQPASENLIRTDTLFGLTGVNLLGFYRQRSGLLVPLPAANGLSA